MPNATQQEEDAETSNDDSENLTTPIIRNQSQIGNFQEGTSSPRPNERCHRDTREDRGKEETELGVDDHSQTPQSSGTNSRDNLEKVLQTY